MGMSDERIRHRLTILTGAVGLSAALTIATLGIVITLSCRFGQIHGELSVLIGHVQLK
jgi:hypothetical protein